MRLKASLRIWLLAGASSIALVAVAVTFSTRTVQADAPLPRPAATAPPAVPEASATQVLPTPKSGSRRARWFHGVASWYGGVFNGRHTASGERFDMYAMTACHPTLPFGSVVRVVNRANHRSVVVRITDRSDLVDGRVIDLSYGAAQRLAMTKDGIAKVDFEVISLGGAQK